MEFPKVKMAQVTEIVFVIICVRLVVGNSTESTSTDDGSTASSMTSTMGITTVTVNTTGSYQGNSTTGSMSSSPPETTPPETTPPGTTPPETTMSTMATSMTTMTSTMLSSSSPKTTPMSTMPSVNTTMTPIDTTQTMATAGPVLGLLGIIAIGAGGGVLLLVLLVVTAFCIYKKSSVTGNRRQSEIDEEFSARMSMHRPDSAALGADGDLAFLTFTGKQNQVDVIVNPTYDTTVISEVPNNNHGTKEKDYMTDEGAATIPSKARLSQNTDGGKDGDNEDQAKDVEGAVDTGDDTKDVEGAVDTGDDTKDVEGAVDASETGEKVVAGDSPAVGNEGEVRPISGVSYKSEDIDLALEVLDVGTV